MKIELPIDSELSRIAGEIASGSGRLILESPPGSGKSTRLAPYLFNNKIKGRIFLLQPRRSSTLMLAHRIAEENGWTLGREVGYQMRLEKKLSADTPLVVSTHGSFVQALSSDPELSGVSTVIVDEFHERSLDIDLLSGMLCYVQRELRADLRIVWMSATGQAESYARALKAEMIALSGRNFPVKILYRPALKKTFDPIEGVGEQGVKVLREILSENPQARALFFLPGQREIKTVERMIQQDPMLKNLSTLELHGSLELSQQERVIRSKDPCQVILCTNIAETSLTLPLITHVLDSGFQKVLSFDESSGLEFLQLENISIDSSTQRAGRAGRTAAGTCFRLWSEDSQRFREVIQKPEILRRNLESVILRLFDFGFAKIEEFPWITMPSQTLIQRILEKLCALELLEYRDSKWTLSPLARGLFRWPLDSRWARFMESAKVISDPDLIRAAAVFPVLMDSQNRGRRNGELLDGFEQQLKIPLSQWSRVESELYQDLCRRADVRTLDRISVSPKQMSQIRSLLMESFPDLLARRRSAGDKRALMASGRGLDWQNEGPINEYFLAMDVNLRPHAVESRLSSWMDLSREELDRLVVKYAREEIWTEETAGKFRFFKQKKIFGLATGEAQQSKVDPSEEQSVLKNLLQGSWAEWLNQNISFQEINRRMNLAFSDLNQGLVIDDLFCSSYAVAAGRGVLSFEGLKIFDFYLILNSLLSHQDRMTLDRLCPRFLHLNNGRAKPFEYLSDGSVDVSVMLKDLLGVNLHPVVGLARLPVRIHLLSPARRPLQVTNNLPGFWKSSYPSIRKELRGRYPKHRWPEDPTRPPEES